MQWSEQGISAAYKFIQKFWNLHERIQIKIKDQELNQDKTKNSDESLEEFTNQIINKINISLDKFSYNVIIANLYEIYNFFSKRIEDKNNNENLINNYEKILKIMIPIMPHFASECLSEIGHTENITWPTVDKKYLHTKENIIVVQINGKKRSIISTPTSIEEENLIEKIKETKELQKYFNEKKIIKSIFIKNKLINLIVK